MVGKMYVLHTGHTVALYSTQAARKKACDMYDTFVEERNMQKGPCFRSFINFALRPFSILLAVLRLHHLRYSIM